MRQVGYLQDLLKCSYRHYACNYSETTFKVHRADILITYLRNSNGPLIVVIKPKANKNICKFCMKKSYPQQTFYHFSLTNKSQ